jgi:hypothetical protein
VSAADSVSLVQRTVAILDAGVVTSHALSRLCGHWCWYFLVRRPFLSILRECYRFIAIFNTNLDVKVIWSSIRRELLMCCCIVPLLQIDFGCNLCSRFVATDASSTGFGVVANSSNGVSSELESVLYKLSSHVGIGVMECSSASFGVVGALAAIIDSVTVPFISAQPVLALTSTSRYQQQYEICQLVQRVVELTDFIVIMNGQWKYAGEHINVLEMHSVLLAVKWLTSLLCVRGRGRKIIMLVDNSCVVYSVRKGRSSSLPLLKMLRRLAAFMVTMDIAIQMIYVPSALNPADAPSRITI